MSYFNGLCRKQINPVKKRSKGHHGLHNKWARFSIYDGVLDFQKLNVHIYQFKNCPIKSTTPDRDPYTTCWSIIVGSNTNTFSCLQTFTMMIPSYYWDGFHILKPSWCRESGEIVERDSFYFSSGWYEVDATRGSQPGGRPPWFGGIVYIFKVIKGIWTQN